MATEKVNRKNNLSLMAVMWSVMAASFGVQTEKNRERDFEQGNFSHFVIGGIVFTIFFVLLLLGIVEVIMYFR